MRAARAEHNRRPTRTANALLKLPRPNQHRFQRRTHAQRFLQLNFERRLLMAILRYEPWALVSRFQQQLDQALNKDADSVESNVSWIPQVDIREEAERFVVTADVPGVEGKDIEITFEKG